MLRTNLSTRPFYNIRAVRLALAVAALVVSAITLFNVLQSISLTAKEGELSTRATGALEDAERVRADARRIRSQVDQNELATLSAAAMEANAVIEQRAFSWIRLLSEIEKALPDNVRVTKVDPRLQNDEIVVAITIEANDVEDYTSFMETLERGGHFSDMLPASESRADDGIIDVVLEGRYVASGTVVSVESSQPTSGDSEGARP